MEVDRQTLFDRRSIVLFTSTTLLAIALLFFLNSIVRVGALIGVATGVVATGTAVLFLVLTIRSGIKRVLFGLICGFFCRMLLVGIGLVLARALSVDMLAFCMAFFAIYLSHQAIEIAAVLRCSRRSFSVEGKA